MGNVRVYVFRGTILDIHKRINNIILKCSWKECGSNESGKNRSRGW